MSLSARRQAADFITTLAQVLGEVDIFSDRRGKHWATKKSVRRYLVEIRGKGEWDCTLEEAARLVTVRTPHTLQMALSRGNGKASFKVEDDIYTVTRFSIEASTGKVIPEEQS